MLQKLATKEYVDALSQSIKYEIDSMPALESIVHANKGKNLIAMTLAPIDFNGCILPIYTMIFIPYIAESTDMMGFATNTYGNHFWAIGHTWTSGGIWSATQII